MLLAVIEKHSSLSISNKDVYVNVVGGLRITEPAVDLALVAALMSAESGRPLPERALLFGEIGLTGEVRTANLALERIREGEKLGFETIYAPSSSAKYLKNIPEGLKLVWIENIGDLERKLFGGVRLKRSSAPASHPAPAKGHPKRISLQQDPS